MKAELEFLKAAAAHIAGVDITGCYIIRDGYIYAGKGPIMAGAPFECGEQFNIPAEDLEAAVSRMPSVKSLTRRGTLAVITGGRLRSTINCIDGEPPELPAGLASSADDVWFAVPQGFCAALGAAVPFVHDSGTWQCGVHVAGDKVVALSNLKAIQIAIAEEMPKLAFTTDAADFICKTEPEEYRLTSSGILFRWSDGRWLRIQQMSHELPDSALTFFTMEDQEATIPLTAEWRAALEDASAMAIGKVELQAKQLIGRLGSSLSQVAIKTPVPDDHVSAWPHASLLAMLNVASHWNPLNYPKACLFVGDNVRGIIMGSKQ